MSTVVTCGTGTANQRQPTEHVYYSSTKSLCKTCKQAVDAKIQFSGGAVYFDKFCRDHGHQRVLVASSVAWYLDALSFVAPHTPPRGEIHAVRSGCPFDCGPCASHQQKVYMPVVPITSACNLDCPICYTVNKNEGAHQLSEREFAAILGHLRAQHDELDIINFTGGEPTMHPELPKLLRMASEAGIRRLTVSTNGLKLRSEAYVRELAAVDARIVLSLDTFDPEVDQRMLGANTVRAKLEALELLEKHDVTTTLLPAIAAGLNDRDLGKLFDLMMRKPNIVSLELHTLTFTGQGGAGFDRTARITTPDLHRLLEEHTGGAIAARDFVPSPLAHPHCYSICYLLALDGGGFVPFARFMGREKLFELLGDSLYIQPREPVEEALRTAMDELWADPDRLPESEALLRTLKRLLREMFPPGKPLPIAQRQKVAERATKAIYIHSHMDEESFDVARVMKCSIGVPEVDGSNIPTCSYNVLYRENDARFADPDMLARMGRTEPHPLLAPAPAPPENRRSLPILKVPS
ncbi:radical SAM protein [Sorangium sp. So ce119]|uniref:radical SAM protein n=1 Tax=Sorangium sp. So ce119 TaxID=3133279 RepID=UPI003F5FA814